MTLLGRWDAWYWGLDKPEPYGDTTTYRLAADFLEDCPTVSDWGCGKGYFGAVFGPGCIGVDGTETPFTDVVADLTEYRSDCDGILLRHVLEHNERWADILTNAVASARRKLCIVLFTPCGEVTKQIAWTEDLGVPDISFRVDDLISRMGDFTVEVEHLSTATQYGEETVLRGTR